jgi:hypothetical protein
MSASKELSEKARKSLQRNTELRKRDSKFLTFQPGEKKALLFDPEKIEPVEREFDGERIQKFQYTVKDPNTDQEDVWPVSKRTSEQVDAFLSVGHALLSIRREGSGRDTRYYILPA